MKIFLRCNQNINTKWRRSLARQCATPGGFTLLEIIVALGLVALLLAALGAAIDFHYRVVQKAREQVEEAQLARTLLERIAKDIRGAVPYDPVNFEKLIPGLVSRTAQSDLFSLAAGAGLDSELLGELTGEMQASQFSGDWTTTTLPRTVPGLYGGSDWIEVDVSRLPRPDQLSSELMLASEGLLIDRVSDVKTVAYFVIPPEETINYSFAPAPGVIGFEERGGLVRRELDRAVTAWAAQSGELDTIDQQLQPIAPEVAAIQFAYFDGSQWVDSWDSDAQGRLPKAVEIRLYLHPKSLPSGATWSESPVSDIAGSSLGTLPSSSGELLLDASAYHVYRTVVYLPAAHETGTLGATGTGESSEQTGSGSEMGPEEELPESSQEESAGDQGGAGGPGGSGSGGPPGGDSRGGRGDQGAGGDRYRSGSGGSTERGPGGGLEDGSRGGFGQPPTGGGNAPFGPPTGGSGGGRPSGGSGPPSTGFRSAPSGAGPPTGGAGAPSGFPGTPSPR